MPTRARRLEAEENPQELCYHTLFIQGSTSVCLGVMPNGHDHPDSLWLAELGKLVESRGFHLHLVSVDRPQRQRQFSLIRVSTIDVLAWVYEETTTGRRRPFLEAGDVARHFYAGETDTKVSRNNALMKARRHLLAIEDAGLVISGRRAGRKIYKPAYKRFSDMPKEFQRLDNTNPLRRM